ncbi:hypothetical protein FNV43_RR04166 [Rhamnella rubrinervis]|uniref:Coactivator CBP, KIX domain-containing protein n=1 Tax=Rhamnella rubrinervis TaxID=2594499 RepID=A0A8K0MQC1_9ROSA|nr:hypothetical protein FNV43_RR04166 [Rhamnella rubrinervis]
MNEWEEGPWGVSGWCQGSVRHFTTDVMKYKVRLITVATQKPQLLSKMPRPGPRPYECVRRAWHSDRHQPMRGSIIQQILRVASEVHSSATKKNKEWQEKLPIVVLKAEEIMYSKANSEAEYMNQETLWDRANDAINTIIRRDESTETGQLLPPCVEAALNLGCIPVRASRSQRHSNPRSYLTPRAPELGSAPSRVMDKTSDERCPQLLPLHSGNQFNFARASTMNSALILSESNSHVKQSNNLTAPRNYPFLLENFPSGHNQLTATNTNTPLNMGSVYPLYYGTQHRTEESQLGPQISGHAHSKTIYVGTPVTTSNVERSKEDCFSCRTAENVCTRINQVDVMDIQEKPQEPECDLSLRLGQFSHPCMSTEKNLACETEDVGSSSSQEGSKMGDMSPSISKEFCFFPNKTACDPFESTSRMWNSGGEGQNLEAAIRKRKAPFSRNEEDGQFC